MSSSSLVLLTLSLVLVDKLAADMSDYILERQQSTLI